MDGFSYVNIFATKGMEYVLTIAFFLVLIPFWIVLNRHVKVSSGIGSRIRALTRAVLKIPRGVFVTRQHTWAFLGSDGDAKVGVDDLIQHLTGDVAVTLLRKSGDEVRKGDILGELKKGDKVLKVHSPVSGRIRGINPRVLEDPGIINVDPYAKGWMIKIMPNDWIGDTRDCFLADDASRYLNDELTRFKDFLGESLARHSPDTPLVTLQDGGEIMDHTLSSLPSEVWTDFQKAFLD